MRRRRASRLIGVVLGIMLLPTCTTGREAARGVETEAGGAHRDGAQPTDTTEGTDEGDLRPEIVPVVVPAVGGDLDALLEMNRGLSHGPIEGWALIYGDASIRSKPSEQGALGRLADWDDGRRAETDADLIPVRVIGRANEDVMVETLTTTEAARHCAGGSLAVFDDYRLRMLVATTELSPVTAKSASQWFQDGTGVGVLAGLPLRAGVDGPVLRLDDGRVEVVLPRVEMRGAMESLDEPPESVDPGGGEGLPLEVGLSYPVPGREDERKTGPVEPLSVTLADVEWRVNGRPVHVGRSGWRPVDVLTMEPHWDGEGGTLATAARHCWTLTMYSDAPRVTEPSPQSLTELASEVSTSEREPSWRVEAGKRAYWEDGVEAGETLREVHHSGEPVRAGDGEDGYALLCFDLAGDLLICHREMELEPMEP